MSDNRLASNIIEFISNKFMHAADRVHDSSCSAEWLYESGRRDAILEMMRHVERICNDEQQKQG